MPITLTSVNLSSEFVSDAPRSVKAGVETEPFWLVGHAHLGETQANRAMSIWSNPFYFSNSWDVNCLVIFLGH